MDEQKQDEELQEEVEEIEQAAEAPAEQPVEDKPVEAAEEPTPAPVQQELPKKLVEQPKVIGSSTPGKMDRLKAFITECRRVLRVTKKPDRQEFTTIVKISSIGMAIIGVIGFLVHFAKELLF